MCLIREEPYDHTDKEYAAWADRQFDTCTKCADHKPGEVRERYSFGIYAGRLCKDCCKCYNDHCGLDRPQGSPNELIEMGENYWEEEEIPIY